MPLEQFLLDGTFVIRGLVVAVAGLFARANMWKRNLMTIALKIWTESTLRTR